MPRIDGEIVIGLPVDVAFDYVDDQSNESQYKPADSAGGADHPWVGRAGHPVPLDGGVDAGVRGHRPPAKVPRGFGPDGGSCAWAARS
jgi:hypothetical protein